jgi:hypothetical protein
MKMVSVTYELDRSEQIIVALMRVNGFIKGVEKLEQDSDVLNDLIEDMRSAHKCYIKDGDGFWEYHPQLVGL